MVEELALPVLERGDLRHLIVGELEVEDVEVLRHALGMHGLRDRHHPALHEPAQDDLSDRLAVLLANRGQHRIGEQIVPALRERSPGLDLDAALAHELVIGHSLMERVGLDLVDGGTISL